MVWSIVDLWASLSSWSCAPEWCYEWNHHTCHIYFDLFDWSLGLGDSFVTCEIYGSWGSWMTSSWRNEWNFHLCILLRLRLGNSLIGDISKTKDIMTQVRVRVEFRLQVTGDIAGEGYGFHVSQVTGSITGSSYSYSYYWCRALSIAVDPNLPSHYPVQHGWSLSLNLHDNQLIHSCSCRVSLLPKMPRQHLRTYRLSIFKFSMHE